MRTLLCLSIATLFAACVAGLPGELDPQSTGAAGTGGSGGDGGGTATGGSAVTGAAATSGPTGAAAQGGGAGTPGGLCEPQCTPVIGCRAQTPATPSSISTFESGCTNVEQREGRDGGWFVAVSPTSTVSPAPDTPFVSACTGSAGSCFSACITGALSGGPYPWALLGFAPRTNAAAYDASRYRGIAFDVMGSIGPQSMLRFRVPLVADTMVGIGDGACTENCFDAYTANLPPLVKPGIWTHVQIMFSDLRQVGYGTPEPWDPTTVITMQWEATTTAETLATSDPFTICVDQVELIP